MCKLPSGNNQILGSSELYNIMKNIKIISVWTEPMIFLLPWCYFFTCSRLPMAYIFLALQKMAKISLKTFLMKWMNRFTTCLNNIFITHSQSLKHLWMFVQHLPSFNDTCSRLFITTNIYNIPVKLL